MQLHQLKSKRVGKKSRRIGRGGKRGTYSGRGIKGQLARSGKKKAPIIRELIKRYPKLKGYRSKPIPKKIVTVNLNVINEKFEEAETVTPRALVAKKIIRRLNGQVPQVKILADGELKKALSFAFCTYSEAAVEKIKKAKGTIRS